MKRGEIYYADLDSTVVSETKKRPVLIVSNNANNRASPTVTIIPITSNIKKVYPFEVLLPIEDSGLKKLSKAQCHQIRTISKMRMTDQKTAGVATKEMMLRIITALKIHLDF